MREAAHIHLGQALKIRAKDAREVKDAFKDSYC